MLLELLIAVIIIAIVYYIAALLLPQPLAMILALIALLIWLGGHGSLLR